MGGINVHTSTQESLMLSNAPHHLKTSQQASPTYFTAVYLSGHFSMTVGSLLK